MIEAANTSGGSPVAAPDDGSVIEALRRGDKIAFAHLVDHYPASLRRGARLYISNRAVADEVVQDTWLGVIQGMWAFEGRSSLETWIFRILIKSVGGINALHPRSPTACVPPPAVHPHLRTLDSRWSRRHSAQDQPPRAPATPPRLSGMLRWHTSAVNRHWEHVTPAGSAPKRARLPLESIACMRLRNEPGRHQGNQQDARAVATAPEAAGSGSCEPI
jgi:Sigma-70 region 2